MKAEGELPLQQHPGPKKDRTSRKAEVPIWDSRKRTTATISLSRPIGKR
jgi:hypothetical protein